MLTKALTFVFVSRPDVAKAAVVLEVAAQWTVIPGSECQCLEATPEAPGVEVTTIHITPTMEVDIIPEEVIAAVDTTDPKGQTAPCQGVRVGTLEGLGV